MKITTFTARQSHIATDTFVVLASRYFITLDHSNHNHLKWFNLVFVVVVVVGAAANTVVVLVLDSDDDDDADYYNVDDNVDDGGLINALVVRWYHSW